MIFNRHKYWTTPPADILSAGAPVRATAVQAERVAAVMAEIGAPATVAAISDAPQAVTYHIALHTLKDATKASRAARALSMVLGPGVTVGLSDRAHMAITAPRAARETVTLYDAMTAPGAVRGPCTATLGIDSARQAVQADIDRLPHMLIAGATGSGKSVAQSALLASLLYNATPEQLQLILIDPKQVELAAYAHLPHLAAPIATSPAAAVDLLGRACALMDKRYRLMRRRKARDIAELGAPRVVIVIDELADLMLTSKHRAEPAIVRLAQLGRAAGIHVVAATQKPLVSVVTGLIQANMPAKLALQTASTTDSVRILGHKGAEALLGRGDALLKLPDRVEPTRLQVAYTSPAETAAIVAHWRRQPVRA